MFRKFPRSTSLQSIQRPALVTVSLIVAVLTLPQCSRLASGDAVVPEAPPPATPDISTGPFASAVEPAAPTTAGESAPGSAKKSTAGIDWEQWAGPRRDLISPETGWSTDWKKNDPKIAWSAEVGTGFASVSVSEGRLYTLGHRDGNDTVYCFDAATGLEIWTHSYESPLVDNLHEGGPAATPTVDGKRVFTLGKKGDLIALDKVKGRVLWERKLEKDLGVKMPEWGFSGSPLVIEDSLFVEAGRLAAYDKATGKPRWSTKVARPGYGSPIAFRRGEKPYLATLNNEALVVVDFQGKIVASHPWKTQYKTTSSTPVIAGGGNQIFVSTGYNEGCVLLDFDGKSLKPVYRKKTMRNHMNNCVLWQGHLYGFDGNSHNRRVVTLKCVDLASGTEQWREKGLGCGSLMLAGGKLVILSDQGDLLVANPDPKKFDELARKKVIGGRCWTVPVLSHGRIYCRNAAGDLVCVDVRGKS